ncbi:MAG: hypothetical protein FD164_1353 [Nitrospirae bacterium]|nr:MAG: hypothetical protein FD164_1353 [Nitrospirota bacterium]
MKALWKKMMVSVVATCVLGAGSAYAAEEAKPAAAAPAEDKVTGSVSLGAYNRYIFRGYELSTHSVVLQPQLSASYKGFTATMWGNIDSRQKGTQSFFPELTNEGPGKRSWNETDLTLSYTYSPLDKLSITGGFIYYGTKYTKETEELFLSATYDWYGKPTLAVYRDIRSYPGTYINMSLSHAEPIYKIATGDITLDLGASAAYFIGDGDYWKTYDGAAGDYSGKKYSAFHDGMLKAGFTIPLGKGFAVSPTAQFTFPLSSKAKKEVDGVSYNVNGKLDKNFVYGVGLTFSF